MYYDIIVYALKFELKLGGDKLHDSIHAFIHSEAVSLMNDYGQRKPIVGFRYASTQEATALLPFAPVANVRPALRSIS